VTEIMSTHHIALFGGTGFVGHVIAERLVQAGHRLTIVTRNRARHRDLLVLPQTALIEGDVYNPVFLRRLLEGRPVSGESVCGNNDDAGNRIDVVANLVGILNERGHRGRGFKRAHIELPAMLVEACRTVGVKRYLHMSALKASSTAPSFYLRTKAFAEEAVLRSNERQFAVTCFRPSVIFGPKDSFINRFAALLKRVPLVFPLACPDSRFQPVYVNDVAEAFVRAIDDHQTHGQSYDLCGPKVYHLYEIVTYITQVLGLRRRIIGLPDAAARLQAMLLEFAPGKPFSLDNYHSLSLDSICDDINRRIERVASLGCCPTAMETVVPTYLSPR
jgi:uncharacterized protein YbjT (DUF2867 family)